MNPTDRLNAMQQRCDAATELTLGDDNAHLAYAVASEDLPATIAALRALLEMCDASALLLSATVVRVIEEALT